MSYQPGDTLETYFCVQAPTTGAATDADSTPTALLKRNGTTDVAVTISIASTGSAGEYRVTGTIPGGYVAGDRVSILATATVSGVTGRAPLGTWILDKRVSTLQNAPAGPTAAAVASQVRVELGTELARLDVSVSTRMASFTYVSPPSADAIANLVWSVSSRSLTDKTGFELATAQRDLIAVAVESHLLNEGDSLPLINALVSAIGNSNVDQTALVAAVRSDLERSGGRLQLIQGQTTGLFPASSYVTPATPGNVTSAQAAIIAALPNDYQRRNVAVTLPAAPEGYGADLGNIEIPLPAELLEDVAFIRGVLEPVGSPEAPVVPIPASPVDGVPQCVVYVDLTGPEADEAEFTATLQPSESLVKTSYRLVAGRVFSSVRSGDRLSVSVPRGFEYTIDSVKLRLRFKRITASGTILNLFSI